LEHPVVILAAGEGSRLRQASALPKPLTPLLGLTLLERSLLTWRKAGAEKFLVVVGYQGQEVTRHAREVAARHGLEVEVVENPRWPEGNGTSVLAVKDRVSGPFYISMVDHVFQPEIIKNFLNQAQLERGVVMAVDPRVGQIFDVERLQQLKSEHETAPIDSAEVKILDDILSLKDTSKVALSYLEKVSKKLPGIEKTVDNFAKRLDFLENNGINVDLLDFEGSYGRTSMEYYDGFVFGFYSETYKDLAPVATGGRYDALTERMGQGKRIPAVGAVLRPDLTLLLRENKHD
jgi:GTP:adenosylcobinamide-phosphate guanylyltransferase